MESSAARIVSRRKVRPSYGASMPTPPQEEIHLTPWDLRCLGLRYIQTGIVLPMPPAGAGAAAGGEVSLVDTLVTSLARALGRYYHFAGRLAIEEHGDGTVTISLRCTGEGAELVHAVAPGVAMADLLVRSPSPSFFPLGEVNGWDAAIDSSIPVLGAQVTQLADGVFIAMSMNHVVGDGACFWELFNAWSAIHRGDDLATLAPAPVHPRWFVETSPVPIRVPLQELQRAVRPSQITPPPAVSNGFFTFSAESVKKLKASANQEVQMPGTISSLQALVAHVWRAVIRARRLPPGEETCCYVVIDCRGRMRGLPQGYVGNAAALGATAGCTAGEILDKGLGWTAWQLHRAVASFDEADVRGWLDGWAREPTLPAYHGGALVLGCSPRFDVFGNDFGWGKPVAVRRCPGETADGTVSAFQGPEQQGSMSLDVALLPETMERLLADNEFRAA